MARFLTLTKSNTRRRGIRKKALGGSVAPGPVTMVVGLVVLFCVLSMMFLVQVFQSSTTGYEVSALQDQIDDLKEDNKKLEIQAAELQSLDSIEKSVQEINMVPLDSIVYVEPPATSIFASTQGLEN